MLFYVLFVLVMPCDGLYNQTLKTNGDLMIHLDNKHIFVFGGSRGIGAEIVRLASAQNAKVSFTYSNNLTAANRLKDEAKGFGNSCEFFQADIKSKVHVQNAVQNAIEINGEIDGLVITAGIFKEGSIENMTENDWHETIDTNLTGTFLGVQACMSSLKKTKGSIVIYTSTAGQRGSENFSAYATSKGAQILFMRSVAKELAPFLVRCNCVAPGWTETEMASDIIDATGRDKIIAQIPLQRIGKPQDAANPALFLLSDCASFITGSTITVDGGFDMRG